MITVRTGNGKGPTVRKQTGAKLREWREHRGLTQDELAAAIGGKPQSVSAWEQGRYDPRPATIRALDKALNADGAIVALYGLADPTADELLTRLSAATERLAADLAALRAAFDAHLRDGRGDGR